MVADLAARAALVMVLTAAASAAQPAWLWRDPGNVAALDFAGSVGTPVEAPQPPYTYLREDLSGTQPKVFVRDARGLTWNVKFGNEVHTESFCWRVVRACGYFAEPSFFIASGKFENYRPIRRATPSLAAQGSFTDARFQFRDPNLKFLTDRNWYWDRPPFAGTRELSGLKILIMLLGNWDNKDARVGGSGSGPNTAIFELRRPSGMEAIYAFTDWGAGLGSILGGYTGRSNWRCAQFSEQSPGFVQRVDARQVVFQFVGAINQGFRTGIPPAHVAWLMNYLGRITDAQLLAGFQAAGAGKSDAACFTRALRMRIEELRKVNSQATASAARTSTRLQSAGRKPAAGSSGAREQRRTAAVLP